MATFTLPTTKRLPGIDPNILPKRADVDYAARADEAWREIEDHLLTIADTEAVYRKVEGRIVNGEDWLQGNKGHEQYMAAYQTLNELHNDRRNLAVNLRSLRRVVWNNVLVLYACMSHIAPDEWPTDHEEAVLIDFSSPESIWRALCPDHEQPGSYPPEKREMWLERKLNYTGWTTR